MSKKRRKNKSLFGRLFNIWDLIFLIVIIGAGTYIFINNGWKGIFDNLAFGLFFGVIVAWLLKFLLKKVRK